MLLGEHIQEEALERYSMGRVAEEDAGPIEEHVLVCADCQERLLGVDDFILAMREAGPGMMTTAPASRWEAWRWLAAFATGWKPALAAAAVATLLVVGFLPTIAVQEPAVETVILRSARGVDSTGAAIASPGRRLALRIDLTALEPLDAYRVDVVDSGGRAVWSSIARGDSETLSVNIGVAPPPGRYWVRLYAPRLRQELLREFGLVVE